jgi:hypothetical protein
VAQTCRFLACLRFPWAADSLPRITKGRIHADKKRRHVCATREAVSHLAERLQAYKVTGEGVEHPFRDSVVRNLVKLVDVLPKLNVTGDPELERLAAQVRASLLVDPQELRKSVLSPNRGERF